MKPKFTCIFKNHIRRFLYFQTSYFSTENTSKQLNLIKHLRKITNEGVTSCKQALVKNNWDINRAASYILGEQESRNILFDENKLNFGKIALCHSLKEEKSVVVDLRSDCDIVASTQLFETVSRSVVRSVLAYLNRQTPEFFSKKPHIFSLDPVQLDSVPNLDSKEDTVGNLLKRTTSQFGKPVVVDSIHVCHSKGKDVTGSYTHKALPSLEGGSSVGSKVGLVSLSCSSSRDLDFGLLKKLADLLALQVVADPNFASMEDFLSLKLLKFEDFNKILDNISQFLELEWSGISGDTTLRRALESVKLSKVGELSLNGVLYVDTGKGSLLLSE